MGGVGVVVCGGGGVDKNGAVVGHGRSVGARAHGPAPHVARAHVVATPFRMHRFEKGDVLGQGTFGVVYQATERATGRAVAIEKMRVSTTKEGASFTALREIKLLQEIRHPNVVELLDVFVHKSSICLVFEYCDTDLESLIRAKQVVLSGEQVRSLMEQLLRGLAVLHAGWVVHRDVKPGNVLVQRSGELRLADFGLARGVASPQRRPLTAQVVTRWYRAPELLWGARHYGPGVDLWAAGCVLAELLLRAPLLPGDSDVEQLGRIHRLLGAPPAALAALPDWLPFEPAAPTPLRALLPAAPDAALELLAALLRWDAAARPPAAAALAHRYFRPPPARLSLPLPLPLPAAAAAAAAAAARRPLAIAPRNLALEFENIQP